MYKMYPPKLYLPKTTAEKIADIIGIVLLVIALAYLAINWSNLPAEIPAHYGFNGEVDRWGSKFELLILPSIAVILHLIMHEVEKRPHTHNYPNRLNESNVKRFYMISRKIVNYTKNICNVLFAYIIWRTIVISLGKAETLGIIPFSMIIIALFVVIIWGAMKMREIK